MCVCVFIKLHITAQSTRIDPPKGGSMILVTKTSECVCVCVSHLGPISTLTVVHYVRVYALGNEPTRTGELDYNG